MLELGAGTGANLSHYGDQVELFLAEPDDHMRARLSRRLAKPAAAKDVQLCSASAEKLPFAADRFEYVVATLVLCSVREPGQAIAEAQRVLRPGGRLLLIEHILAPSGTSRWRWQQRLEPIWPKCAGGCHLIRDPRSSLSDVGLQTEWACIDELVGAPTFLRTVLRGAWQKPVR